jgi:NADH:ubiquinone oxidoreductase subunit E
MIWRINLTKHRKMTDKIKEYLKKYDLDDDGKITDEELKRTTEILELELREEKAEAQKRMSWVAILSMVLFTIALFTPYVSESRVAALADLLGLFYLAQASVVGFYFGAQAYMSKK